MKRVAHNILTKCNRTVDFIFLSSTSIHSKWKCVPTALTFSSNCGNCEHIICMKI